MSPDPTSDAQHLLQIYVQDHLAVAAAGVRRARRLAAAERDGPDGRVLGEVASEIALDRQALQAVADTLGIAMPRVKQLAARAAEWVGLAKLNGRLVRRSPLSTLVEVEAMLIAVRGKLAGWETLRRSLGAATVGPVDLDELIARSRRQHDALADVHARVGPAVLGRATPT